MNSDLMEIEEFDDFNNHKFVSCFSDEKFKLHGFIAIHRGNCKVPAFGATRIVNYPNTRSALVDALRLSKTMSEKAALAGLHCGGGKAVIISDGKIKDRAGFLKSYADKVNLLAGHFITGADVGISKDDVKIMRKLSRFFVGVKADPVRYTGLGLVVSLRQSLKRVFGSGKIRGKSIAIQGVGKIGAEFLSRVYPFTKNIYIADIDIEKINILKSKYLGITVVDSGEIDKLKVDIFSPCALSNCLNRENVNKLKCSIVVGGANCQLESIAIGKKLHNNGILYAPDYLINAGGLIRVYDEYEFGNTRVRRVTKRVRKIKRTLNRVFEISDKKNVPPFIAANSLAEEIFEKII